MSGKKKNKEDYSRTGHEDLLFSYNHTNLRYEKNI